MTAGMAPSAASGEANRITRRQAIHDRFWVGGLRTALCCSVAFFGLCVVLDRASGGLTLPRAGLWGALALLVFAVLLPPLVTAGDGWLSVRGTVRTQRVRTDALMAVQTYGSVAARLVLRDAHGGRVALDPRVLMANPVLWHLLEAGAHRSLERGTLHTGSDVLRLLARSIDTEAARAVFDASGMR